MHTHIARALSQPAPQCAARWPRTSRRSSPATQSRPPHAEHARSTGHHKAAAARQAHGERLRGTSCTHAPMQRCAAHAPMHPCSARVLPAASAGPPAPMKMIRDRTDDPHPTPLVGHERTPRRAACEQREAVSRQRQQLTAVTRAVCAEAVSHLAPVAGSAPKEKRQSHRSDRHPSQPSPSAL